MRLVVLIVLTCTFVGCGVSHAADTVWHRVVPGGDCECSDGSAFRFWMRTASPQKVVLYLEDGGACFSAETCAPRRDLYTTRIDGRPPGRGIFDFADKRNPFADYSFVYVPYCTGDVHLGDVTTTYAAGLTVHHKGYVNGIAALDRLVHAFPNATEVVVVGESAGSIAAPVYAALASDRLPDARIVVLADGSGAYPDVHRIKEVVGRWGRGRWSPPGLFVQSARHDRAIVFARHDYVRDATQAAYLRLLGIRPAKPDANEQRIERAGVDLHSYVAPGREHTVLSDGLFYRETVRGVKLVDWVAKLIDGKRVEDVR